MCAVCNVLWRACNYVNSIAIAYASANRFCNHHSYTQSHVLSSVLSLCFGVGCHTGLMMAAFEIFVSPTQNKYKLREKSVIVDEYICIWSWSIPQFAVVGNFRSDEKLEAIIIDPF